MGIRLLFKKTSFTNIFFKDLLNENDIEIILEVHNLNDNRYERIKSKYLKYHKYNDGDNLDSINLDQ